jgi:sugar-specific transcriptional regulator TrmB
VIFLLFMILAMLVVLAITSMKQGKESGGSEEDPTVQAIKADLEARRSELNRQRMAMGLAPLENGSEPVENIAKRLRADAETLAGISGKFQQMLADKDAELTASNAETLRLLKLRQDVSVENARLQSELQRALIGSSDTDRLKTMLLDSQAQRDALSLELADVKQRLSEQAGAVSADDFADLQRRYEEAVRARDFFEARAKELEEASVKADLFADSEKELLPAAVELFRRMTFNVLISNVDDHLRNHGFLWVGGAGWKLSPAYDVNPVPQDVRPRILATGISFEDGTCDLDLVLSVAELFGLSRREAKAIVKQVGEATATWREVAETQGARARECERMRSAFEHADLEKVQRL